MINSKNKRFVDGSFDQWHQISSVSSNLTQYYDASGSKSFFARNEKLSRSGRICVCVVVDFFFVELKGSLWCMYVCIYTLLSMYEWCSYDLLLFLPHTHMKNHRLVDCVACVGVIITHWQGKTQNVYCTWASSKRSNIHFNRHRLRISFLSSTQIRFFSILWFLASHSSCERVLVWACACAFNYVLFE